MLYRLLLKIAHNTDKVDPDEKSFKFACICIIFNHIGMQTAETSLILMIHLIFFTNA